METWMWISLYVLQTLIFSILFRKYVFNKDTLWVDKYNNSFVSFLFGASSIISVPLFLLFLVLSGFIYFLAGIKKTEEK